MNPERQNPRPAGTGARDQKKNSNETISRFAREIAAILAIGAMVGVMFWQSVFGMAADLASGPMAPVHMAEVSDGR